MILQSFQKDKNPGLDGRPMEFFIWCFEFIGEDLRSLVEASKLIRNMIGAFNNTFLALIPKDDNPSSFAKFRPISLCKLCLQNHFQGNSQETKEGFLSRKNSNEQFGFLEGRQIHEAIGIT